MKDKQIYEIQKNACDSLVSSARQYKYYLLCEKYQFLRNISPLKFLWVNLTKDIHLDLMETDVKVLKSLRKLEGSKR